MPSRQFFRLYIPNYGGKHHGLLVKGFKLIFMLGDCCYLAWKVLKRTTPAVSEDKRNNRNIHTCGRTFKGRISNEATKLTENLVTPVWHNKDLYQLKGLKVNGLNVACLPAMVIFLSEWIYSSGKWNIKQNKQLLTVLMT